VAELLQSQAAAIERELVVPHPPLEIELRARPAERLEALGYLDE
jgi:hypothetical protein